jgi:hypothetical protein
LKQGPPTLTCLLFCWEGVYGFGLQDMTNPSLVNGVPIVTLSQLLLSNYHDTFNLDILLNKFATCSGQINADDEKGVDDTYLYLRSNEFRLP